MSGGHSSGCILHNEKVSRKWAVFTDVSWSLVGDVESDAAKISSILITGMDVEESVSRRRCFIDSKLQYYTEDLNTFAVKKCIKFEKK